MAHCIIKRIIAMTVILPQTVLPNASAATLLPSERHPVAARPVLPAPLSPELSKLLAHLPVQDDAEALRKSLFHAGTHFNPDLLTSEAERRRNGLDALLEWYGLGARGGHHDAYGDAALLSRVFFELWWDLDEWLYGE